MNSPHLEKTKPEDFFLKDLEVPIFVRKFRGNKKIPIFLIHGLSGNIYSLNTIAKYLHSFGYTVFVYDLRGRGNSGKPKGEYSKFVHAKDLKSILEYFSFEKVHLVAHSLGAWIAMEVCKQIPNKIQSLTLLDGGGASSVLSGIRNLKMVRESLKRLAVEFPSKETYFELAKQSPLVSEWSEDLELLLDYELEESNGKWVSNFPTYVAEAELQALGGSLNNWTLLKNLIFHPIQYFQKKKRNSNLEYDQIKCPVLLLRAEKTNYKNKDYLISDSALSRMEKDFLNLRAIRVLDQNHYGLILNPCAIRDREMIQFLNRFE